MTYLAQLRNAVALTAVGTALALSMTANDGSAGEYAPSPVTHEAHLQLLKVAPPAPARRLRKPCEQEDSVNCYWNAKVQGNGHGHSFWVVQVRLLSVNGHHIGHVDCHLFVGRRADHRWTECQRTGR